jgi:hypothetical protein
VHLGGEPQRAAERVIVVAEETARALDGHVLQAISVEDRPRPVYTREYLLIAACTRHCAMSASKRAGRENTRYRGLK